MAENQNEVGYSQFTGGANGLMTSGNCIGLPNTVATAANVFAPGCILYEKGAEDGYVETVWQNTGTTAAPVWTVVTTGNGTQIAKVSLTSAQILTLNTTPIVLIPAPLSTQAIEVLAVMGNMTFLTAAYGTHTELDIIDTTAGTKLYEDTGTLLAATGSLVAQVEPAIAANAANVITAGGSVSAKVATGNPATGAGSLILYVTYRIINL